MTKRRSLRARIASLFDGLHRLAEAGWAVTAVTAYNTLQGSVLPGPADALFLPLGLADTRRVWHFAGAALAGSMLGAMIAWAIGHFAFDTIGLPILGMVGFDAGDVERSRATFEKHGWLILFLSTVTPVSTKLFSIAAGAFGLAFLPFLLVLGAGRAVRFAALSLVVIYAGHRLQRWVRKPPEPKSVPQTPAGL